MMLPAVNSALMGTGAKADRARSQLWGLREAELAAEDGEVHQEERGDLGDVIAEVLR